MKIKLFIIVIICLIPGLSGAQVISGYGIKGAFTRSMFETEEGYNFSTWRSGFNAAVYAEKEIFESVSLVIQLEYCQKGYCFEQVETDETGMVIQDVRAITRLDYISVPLFLKVIYPAHKFSPFVTIGPRFDYLVHIRKGRFEFASGAFTDDFADHLKSGVLGGSISCGLQMPVSNQHRISLEFRYNYDFSDSAEEPVLYTVKNKSYDIWLGIGF